MQCPICRHELAKTEDNYTLEQLFLLWAKEVKFSDAVINEHHRQASTTTLYCCSYCELGIFFPQIIGSPGLYIEFGNTRINNYYMEDKWEYRQALHDLGGENSVVEIGCGRGAFLKKVHSENRLAIGIEYNPEAVQFARSQGLQVYGLSEQDIFNSMKGNFDAVFSFQVLEHVADPMEFMRECMKWIKPGGTIGIAVPNSAGIIRHYRNNILNLPPHHATRWSPRTLVIMAKELNLNVEHVAYEPLSAPHYEFIRHYWNSRFIIDSGLSKYVQKAGSLTLTYMITVIKMLGIRHLPVRGHSVYILMSKPW